MKKALELQPEQPHVLNYLGYSWIDQGINLDEGMKMIKRAVDQRPDDGYIVDSLGWAYYRIGNYEDAVKNLERAIDLKPEDPTINDHLGDAYWRVGRTLEAKFQWAHARDLKPEPEELPKIEAKIENGLPDDTSSAASADKKKRRRQGRLIAGLRGWSPMPALIEDGRAKVNLTLRVVGRRADGYHDLESVVAFADCADRLTLDARTGTDRSRPTGPLAQRLRRDRRQSRAQGRAAARRARAGSEGRRLRAGQGACRSRPASAAARRMPRRRCGCWRGSTILRSTIARLLEVARATGADVPVCLASRACDMTGVGETLLPLTLPKMPCVLVNPRVPVATKDVFAGARPAQRRIAGRRHRRDRRRRPGRKTAHRSTNGSKRSPPAPTISKRRRCGSSR